MTLLEHLPPPVVVADARERAGRRPVDDTIRGSRAWQVVTLAVAAVVSVVTTVIVHVTGHSGLWGDEPSHLLHARRFYDALHPGFGQLGNYWPPLIHWAELPLAWNQWLVRTGLAGQIPAMAMFLVAVAGVFALGVELSRRRSVGAIAALVLVANPNMLFLQSSAMMESGLVMTLAWTAVWLLRFRRSGRFRDVLIAAAWSAVAVFATWAALILPLYGGAIVAAACRRLGFEWGKTRAYTAAYAVLNGYAVALWLGWNWYVQRDALYMIHYRHPDTVQAPGTTALTRMRPDLPRGLLSLGSAALDNVGPVVFAFAVIVLLVGLLRGKVLHPLGVTLIGGVLVVAEWTNGQGGLSGSPTFAWLSHLGGRDATGMNVRYALWVLPFMAGAVAVAAGRRRWRQVPVALLVLASTVWFLPAARGVVTVHSADMVTRADEQVAVAAGQRLHDAYAGGEILTSASGGGDRTIWLSGLPARDFITQFDGKTFTSAVRNPAAAARYVLLTTALRNEMSESTLSAAGFHQLWSVVVAGDRQTLWVRDDNKVASP